MNILFWRLFSNISNLKSPLLGNACLGESEVSFNQLSAVERSPQQGFYLLPILFLTLIESEDN